MPNLFGNLPADTLLDAGIISVGSTPIGVSRGGLSGRVEPEWRSVVFDGRQSAVAGLDRKVGIVAKFAGTFIEFAQKDVELYEAQETGSLSGGLGAPSLTVAAAAAFASAAAAALTAAAIGVIAAAKEFFTRGRYVQDLRLTFQRGGGGDVRIIFPLAICAKYDLKGKDKEEAEIALEFEARLDMLTATDTDQLPYYVEVR